MIPASFIQDLLARIDIIEVIGRHVQLKKAGINHKGLCPFHGEKTPSFTVSATRQTYHCFGCGVHGNAVGFLMEHLGIGFVDAVRELAQQTGMTVPEDDSSPEERERAAQLKQRQSTLTDVLSKAKDHYRIQLRNSPKAIDYLKMRGLSGEIAARFAMGYAPPGWRSLASAFAHYDDPLLTESGLVIAHEDDSSQAEQRKRYDRFRDRIMFPIRSVQGDVIGFGGRVLDQGEPKYLNSPETPVFSKGHELYGLFEGKAAMRQQGYALVVEGYMDVVALAQSGFENAVATLGTACTQEHVHKLFRFTESVVFSFDGDAAGRRAAGRALEAALPHASDTRTIRFLFLPEEHDPDSFVRQHGREAFAQEVQRAIPLSRQLIDVAQDGVDLSMAEGRARFLINVKPLWFALPDGALKRQLLPELAQLGGLSTADLAELWKTHTVSAHAVERPSPTRREIRRELPVASKYQRNTPRHAPASPADHAMRMLLLHSEWWDQLTTADHELLHSLPAPHGPIFAWLERQLADHGAMSWAVLEQGLIAAKLQDKLGTALVPPSALEDEMSLSGLQSVLNAMWIERLAQQQTELIALAATDSSALSRWREISMQIEERRKAKLEALKEPRP